MYIVPTDTVSWICIKGTYYYHSAKLQINCSRFVIIIYMMMNIFASYSYSLHTLIHWRNWSSPSLMEEGWLHHPHSHHWPSHWHHVPLNWRRDQMLSLSRMCLIHHDPQQISPLDQLKVLQDLPEIWFRNECNKLIIFLASV